MRLKHTCAVLITFSMLFFVGTTRAALITPMNSGYWSSTVTNEPWPNGILPTTNDFVEVTTGITITNNTTNAVCEALDSSEDTGAATGTVLMEPNSVLTVCGQNEGYGAYDLDVLDATATNCTVIYQGNSFWAKHTDYWNLVFSGWGDFYNGSIYGNPATPMTIYGNFIMDGTNVPSDQTSGYTGCYVECGDDITVDGDLYIGPSNAWDCSVGNITVYGKTICAGMLWDKDAADGSNNFVGGVTIVTNGMWLTNVQNTLVAKLGWTNADNIGPNDVYGPGNAGVRGGAWYIMDVQWAVGGNLTNDGIVGFGTNYGSITMYGNGVMAGTNPIYMPTLFINGTNELLDTVNLTTNYPTVDGTLIFDLANTNEITLDAGANAFYYSTNGTLEVIDSGPAPAAGHTYQLFDNLANANYAGQYETITLPALPGGLTWTNELLVDGSIAVLGSAPINITSGSSYNPGTSLFKLTWSSTAGAYYTVLESPTLNPPNWTSLQSNIPSGGTTTTVTVTMPAGTKGFLRVMSQ